MVDFALWYDDISLCAILVENFLNHYRPLFKFSSTRTSIMGQQIWIFYDCRCFYCIKKISYFNFKRCSLIDQVLNLFSKIYQFESHKS
jgi:hypothetical protein